MDDFSDELYPSITMETDELTMTINVKKDYSSIIDLNIRKKEFIKDLHSFIDEFDETQESLDFIEYFSD